MSVLGVGIGRVKVVVKMWWYLLEEDLEMAPLLNQSIVDSESTQSMLHPLLWLVSCYLSRQIV